MIWFIIIVGLLLVALSGYLKWSEGDGERKKGPRP